MIEFMLPIITVLLIALGSVMTLKASELILADEGDYHVGGVRYQFTQKNYEGVLLSAFLMGGMYVYVYPNTYYGMGNYNWIPMMIIVLLSVQSVIDLKYFELADEWTSMIAMLALLWRYLSGGITWSVVGFAFGLFLFYFITWFFVGFPGYGDVKLVLATGILLTSLESIYFFIAIASFTGATGTIMSCIIDEKPLEDWLSAKFAYGPYLSYTILLLMLQVI